jgi:hypothetical protein
MLTANRNAQLDDLLGISIADFDIPDDVYRRAVDRYEDLGAWLSDYWDASPTDGIVYPQGSFRLGTVVQPVKPGDEYDVDLVCRRDIAKTSTTQAVLKIDCGNGIGSYVATGPDGAPIRSEGKRCWTLHYPGEPFHMDALPAIPDEEGTPNAILLTDRDLREWQHSNPIDYADWFYWRMREEFLQIREVFAKRMEVADVPRWRVKTTLQRSVQALKRHRDLYFSESPDDRPASIIITTLAATAYIGGGTLYEVLADITAKMPGLVEVRNGLYWVANPVQPEENFADRWLSHPDRASRFFEWMAQVQEDVTGYGGDLGVDLVLEKLAKSFGERSAHRAGESLGTGISRAREAGLLGMAAGTGMLGAVAHRPVPQHTFHGGTRPGLRGQ